MHASSGVSCPSQPPRCFQIILVQITEGAKSALREQPIASCAVSRPRSIVAVTSANSTDWSARYDLLANGDVTRTEKLARAREFIAADRVKRCAGQCKVSKGRFRSVPRGTFNGLRRW